MPLTTRVDSIELRHLQCQKCRRFLIRKWISKRYALQCLKCDSIWYESDIREGKAKGIVSIDLEEKGNLNGE